MALSQAWFSAVPRKVAPERAEVGQINKMARFHFGQYIGDFYENCCF